MHRRNIFLNVVLLFITNLNSFTECLSCYGNFLRQLFKIPLMKKSVKIFWIVFLSGIGAFLLLIALIMTGVFGKLPSLDELENPSILQASEIFATDGTLMGKYYKEKGNRSIVKYRDISKHVVDALVATEDERFYEHSGIDWKRTV